MYTHTHTHTITNTHTHTQSKQPWMRMKIRRKKNIGKHRQNKKRKEADECAGSEREGRVCATGKSTGGGGGGRVEGCRCVYKSADGKRRDVQAAAEVVPATISAARVKAYAATPQPFPCTSLPSPCTTLPPPCTSLPPPIPFISCYSALPFHLDFLCNAHLVPLSYKLNIKRLHIFISLSLAPFPLYRFLLLPLPCCSSSLLHIFYSNKP